MTEKKPNRVTYPKDTKQALKDKIRSLQARNKAITKENTKLKEELRQIQRVFDKQIRQIKDLSDKFTVEEMIEMAKIHQEREKIEKAIKERESVRKNTCS